MAKVEIPSLMRDLTQGQHRVEVPGRTVRQVIEALDERYPGVKGRLCRGDELSSTITVSVDGHISRRGLFQRVSEQSEVRFLPVIEGG
ncbi:MAG: MoaD/ThiS family protein [Anaerolineae bacterium]